MLPAGAGALKNSETSFRDGMKQSKDKTL